MKISEFVERLESLKQLAGDVEVIIKPFYDEPPYEVAAVECINVVEGKSEEGQPLWLNNFDDDDPRVITRVHVF
jgi:hypothetical protein